jgi:ubiquinone/menaquinone biosynthesis C-methylase UbiE
MGSTEVVDSLVKDLLKQVDNAGLDWMGEKEKLQTMLDAKTPMDRAWAFDQIHSHCQANKSARILDYGCGSGILNLLLLLKGYDEVHGVDVVEKFDSRILQLMNFDNASFSLLGEDDPLPFDDNSFDVISSSLVLEHVKNVDLYYSEAARVLKPGGVCFFNFPHRLKPYDSHSRCWFIHYFPKPIRKILWDLFARQGGEYLNDYLFLRTAATHRRIAQNYFTHAEDTTVKRIERTNFVNYKGNSRLRVLAGKLISSKYLGSYFAKAFSLNASTDLYLIK